jgi:hypothetical protein
MCVQVKPTHVLNAAGLTGRPNVDWCETHKVIEGLQQADADAGTAAPSLVSISLQEGALGPCRSIASFLSEAVVCWSCRNGLSATACL